MPDVIDQPTTQPIQTTATEPDMIEQVINVPDQHAFVMLGEKTLFLSHLTMFHMEDHMYEFIVEASLPDWAMKRYLEDRERNPGICYFLGNDTTDLMTIPDLANGTRTCFWADIWCDIPYKKEYTEWPWNGHTPLLTQVKLTIERVVSYRHFDFCLGFPENLTYVMFGSGEEAHLSHYQVREPDFDHVLSLQTAPTWLSQSQLLAGVHINFPGMRDNPPYCSNPLPRGSYNVTYGGKKTQFPIEVGTNYWFCTKVVNSVNPCQDDL